jgi:hypothetical protein
VSLERYFQRAHDEARRLLRDAPWAKAPAVVHWPHRWMVAAVVGDRVRVRYTDNDGPAERLRAGVSRLVGAAWLGPFGLQQIVSRAMADTDGSPTLAAGEGAEARRLLEMVDWDRVPQARWPDVFDTLRMAVAAKALGYESWEATTMAMLAEDGWLAEAAERSAA